jgi:hypothetical protein
MLIGLALMFAAGAASAQTSVQLSLGFGAPRPYVSGDVFIGRSFVRPLYQPYYYYPYHYPYYFYQPLPRFYGPSRRVFIYERDHRFYRRDFDRRDFDRRDFDRRDFDRRDFDRDRGRDRDRADDHSRRFRERGDHR